MQKLVQGQIAKAAAAAAAHLLAAALARVAYPR
jgi:hypothetical protein